jgi:hypothetical protein
VFASAAAYPIVSFALSSVTAQQTVNFKGSFAQTVPSGFSAWDSGLPGYSTAVDGDVVPDLGAIFRAVCRFKQTLPLYSPPPAQAGYLYAYPKFGRASTTYFLDPKLGITSAALSAEALQFLLRAPGLDSTHVNAYMALIDGLVADGIWAKLDVLHVYATQNSTTALLNLVSSSYAATYVGSPTFTADRGFTGVSGNNGAINTNFNPSTGSHVFTQNSAHISAWSVIDIGTTSIPFMGGSSGSWQAQLHAKFTDNNAYISINGPNAPSYANATRPGHYLANRSNSSSVQGYKNGVSQTSSSSNTSVALPNIVLVVCGSNNSGAVFTTVDQAAMASIGSSLSSTDVTNFYNRLRTYMTAVGVP